MTERAQTAIYQAVAVIVPALAALAPRATAPVMVAAALGLASLFAVRRRPLMFPSFATWGGLAVLVAWAALSNLWSIEPSWRGVAILAGGCASGLLLIRCAAASEPRALGRWLVIGMSIGLFIYAFEAISGNWLTRFAHQLTWRDIIDDLAGGINTHAYLINGTAILSLLVWPIVSLLVQRSRRLLALASLIAVVLAVGRFGSDAGLIAIVVGALAWEITARLGRPVIRIVAVLFAILVLAMPLAAHRLLVETDLERLALDSRQMPSSAVVRLFIWKFTTERIAERPLLGWGFDTARHIPGGDDAIQTRTPDGQRLINDITLPLHPHNQVLQIWLELGAFGAMIVAIAGAALIWRIGSQPPPIRNGALALVTTIFVYDLASFGVWQSWWIAAVFIAIAIQCAITAPREIRL
jgi:exopolysaccharide production protein ExoQ